MAWITPKTDWTTNDAPISSDINRWEENTRVLQTGEKEHILLISTGQTTLARDGGKANIGTTLTDEDAKLRITGNTFQIIGSQSNTDLLQKTCRIASIAYDITNSPVGMLYNINDVSSNRMIIGGGSGVFTASTIIDFYTAETVNTTTGTIRGRMHGDGNFTWGTSVNSGPRLIVADSIGSLPSLSSATVGLFQNNNLTTTDSAISIISGVSGISSINLGDSTNEDVNNISADNLLNTMAFTTATVERMRISTAGHLLVNTTSDPGETVHIDGSMRITGSTHPFIVKSTGFLDDTWMDGTLFVDTIAEKTGAAGVTIDSVLLKDGQLRPTKGLKITSSIDSASITENLIFDAIAPFIPNNGDDLVMTGGIGNFVVSEILVISRAVRTSGTVITVYGIEPDNGNIGNFALTDGGVTVYKASLGW